MAKSNRLTGPGQICYMCGGTVDSSGQCTRCLAYVGGRDWTVRVEGTDAAEVERVAKKLSHEAGARALERPRSPWVSGSFYLVVAIVAVAVLLTAARVLPPLLLPVVIVGAVMLISIVGALQLRQDDKLGQKNFLTLMGMALAQLRLIRRSSGLRRDGEASARDQGAKIGGADDPQARG